MTKLEKAAREYHACPCDEHRAAVVHAGERYLHHVANKLPCRGAMVSHGDLVNAAAEGMLQALDRYVPEGQTFMNYSWMRVYGSMVDYLRRATRHSKEIIYLHGSAGRASAWIDVLRVKEDDQDEALDVELALCRVSEADAALLRDVYFRDMKQSDLAREEGVTPAAICIRLRGARQRLRPYLQDLQPAT